MESMLLKLANHVSALKKLVDVLGGPRDTVDHRHKIRSANNAIQVGHPYVQLRTCENPHTCIHAIIHSMTDLPHSLAFHRSWPRAPKRLCRMHKRFLLPQWGRYQTSSTSRRSYCKILLPAYRYRGLAATEHASHLQLGKKGFSKASCSMSKCPE